MLHEGRYIGTYEWTGYFVHQHNWNPQNSGYYVKLHVWSYLEYDMVIVTYQYDIGGNDDYFTARGVRRGLCSR
jgi:hypothetical protein